MRYLIAFIIILTSMTAFAQNQCQVTKFPFVVPFKLNPNECVRADYNFTDSTGTHPLIFCYQSNPSKSATLTWQYKNKPQSASMPITLKTHTIYSGKLADSKGTLAVYNTSKVSMYVVCQYAF